MSQFSHRNRWNPCISRENCHDCTTTGFCGPLGSGRWTGWGRQSFPAPRSLGRKWRLQGFAARHAESPRFIFWLISWKNPTKNGWWLGENPMFGNLHVGKSAKSPRFLKAMVRLIWIYDLGHRWYLTTRGGKSFKETWEEYLLVIQTSYGRWKWSVYWWFTYWDGDFT